MWLKGVASVLWCSFCLTAFLCAWGAGVAEPYSTIEVYVDGAYAGFLKFFFGCLGFVAGALLILPLFIGLFYSASNRNQAISDIWFASCAVTTGLLIYSPLLFYGQLAHPGLEILRGKPEWVYRFPFSLGNSFIGFLAVVASVVATAYRFRSLTCDGARTP